MLIPPGTIIKGTDLLKETIFEGTVILITSNDDNGAVGFIINQASSRTLNQLVEFAECKPFQLHNGGPVDEEHLFFIHSRADLIPNGELVKDNIYYGGDFATVVSAINQQQITPSQLKIFIGYCGWDAGELEAEMEEGSWDLLDDVAVFDF